MMIFIPEPDVYRLILRSKLPTAEKFEKWVVETDALTNIRNTAKEIHKNTFIPNTPVWYNY